MNAGGKHYWWVVVVILVPLAVWGGYRFYWQVKYDQTVERAETAKGGSGERLGLPKELAEEFDPAETVAVFRVIGAGEESGQLKLSYVLPKTMDGKEVAPRLACQAWDYKVFEAGAKVPRYVTAKEMLAVIARTTSSRLLLSGKCSDGSCTRLDRECTLTITAERREE